ncbi:cytochrome P450 [Mycena sp. CBHHK59/15]|nr:cytochrome P450 [Mycena sp. CBHHK59/15]
MYSAIFCVGIFTLILCALNAWRLQASRRRFISHIPGPRAVSWLYGNMPELLLSREYGEHEFQWQKQYGPVYRIKGCFSENRLMISDPVAAKHIINNPVFIHGGSQQKAANILFGEGNVFLAEAYSGKGESPNLARTMSDIELILESQLVDRWESLGFPGNTVDVAPTLHDAALDAMGDGILGHSFNALLGAIESAPHMYPVIRSQTKIGLLVDAIIPCVPGFLFRLALRIPLAGVLAMQAFIRITDDLTSHLVQESRDELSNGIESDQTFIRNFLDYSPENPISTPFDVKDIAIQLRAVLIASEDTSGNTAGWVLYKLAQMPDLQTALREEIRLASVDGRDELDYDAMPVLKAVINETLRFYAPLPLAERVPTEDCVLPLTDPIITSTGERITELPIKKGQNLYVTIASYNRLPSAWGPDAYEFRPSRWLEKDGILSNGMGIGPRAPLVLELQVFVVELIQKFVLSVPENDSVRPCVVITLVPKTADGVQCLPLHVEAV